MTKKEYRVKIELELDVIADNEEEAKSKALIEADTDDDLVDTEIISVKEYVPEISYSAFLEHYQGEPETG